MPSNEDDILTVAEVAERLRLAPSWIYAHADDLGAYRLGKYLRFSWKRLVERLEKRAGEAGVGVAAQRPPKEHLNTKLCNPHGTTREQRRLDI
jgi:hypothetical protein